MTNPDAASDHVDFESNYDRRGADAEDWSAEPSPELLADIELLRSGEIDHDELVEQTLARYRPD